VLTCREWVDRYLVPLAHSDLVVDGLREATNVVRVESILTTDNAENLDGEELPPPNFRLQLHTSAGETSADAHAVVDAGGASAIDGEAGPLRARLGGGDVTFAEGLVQIRELFASLAGRGALDLYASMRPRANSP
jgi:hypothetical protein